MAGTVGKRLLGRELTAKESAVAALIRKALLERGGGEARAELQHAIKDSPETLLNAALAVLESLPDAAGNRRLYMRLLEFPDFLQQLIRPDRFSRSGLLEICRVLQENDALLDVRLARLISGRQVDMAELDSNTVVHVLDILNEISPGPRLILTLNHLTHHPNPRTAAKATLLMARRIRNNNWMERHLTSTDPRLRASVLEALWGVDTPAARRALWSGSKDPNNRVAGNALLGLHLLNERRAGELARGMLADERPAFRATAAWVMEKMGKSEFTELLQKAVTDDQPGVRQAARRALKAIRGKTPVEAQPQPVAQPAPSVQPKPEPEKETLPPAAGLDFDLHLDGRHTSTR